MNVLFVASECVPFSKTGGLADVIGSLPSSIAKQHNVDIRIMLPLYGSIPDHFKKEMKLKDVIVVSVSWRRQYCGIFELHYNGLTYYFIDNEYYFKRDDLYGYYDDAERFTFFSHAVLAALPVLSYQPDIIHCHDWQTALIPTYLKTTYAGDLFYKEVQTVFTIHNLKYQGIFSPDVFQELLHFSDEHYAGLEFNGAINFMKGAIVHSHLVTTVSKSYANEIQTEYYGEGLQYLLQDRGESLIGIVNGIDYNDYNPATDERIPHNYQHSELEKVKNKIALQEMVGLPVREDVPLFAVITRLVEQKGLPLIQHVMDELAGKDIQFILLGTGDAEFEHFFKEMGYRYPEKVSVHITFQESLARTIYAASDFFLMPSRFEPCGIGQLLALRYETVPIVRETGGLQDTVHSYNKYDQTGNGFTFANYNAHDMLYTIERALAIYREKEHWNALLNNIYQTNFSWDHSAKRYSDMYKQLSYIKRSGVHLV
ncbi:glycogen synthase GlgA [Bacillus alkalicellulosilyticus]|uniref:glycogen synthase GlgA n=1 Tax=Alkalihalobacterium alkalicellulosilyticum TaxID=1912214 RepID=UPI0009980989|nr:glycogen synthase GlgA [Bacillus alkalicellulosilyticus]